MSRSRPSFNELRIRRATPSDALAVAAAHVECWRETYAELIPARVLAVLDVEARAFPELIDSFSFSNHPDL